MRFAPPLAYPDGSGRYRNHQPGVTVDGSWVPAEFVNATQDEIVAVITAGGGTPTVDVNNQLLAAIRRLIQDQERPYVEATWSATVAFNTLTTALWTASGSSFRDPATTFASGVLTVGPLDAGFWTGVVTMNAARTDTNLLRVDELVGDADALSDSDVAPAAGGGSGMNLKSAVARRLANGANWRVKVIQQNAASLSQAITGRLYLFRNSN